MKMVSADTLWQYKDANEQITKGLLSNLYRKGQIESHCYEMLFAKWLLLRHRLESVIQVPLQ